MGARPGQKLVGVYVEEALAERFYAWARLNGGGVSPALRRLISEAVGEVEPAAVRGCGTGQQVGVRFRQAERALLAAAAQARGTTPADWLRCLAIAHLARRPGWSPDELAALRDVFVALRRIGTDVARLAENSGGTPASGQQAASAASEAASAVRAEMRRVVAIMTGNLDYWGVPTEDEPRPRRWAIDEERVQARTAVARRRRRATSRPGRFGPEEP